jgi:hypothetical protein
VCVRFTTSRLLMNFRLFEKQGQDVQKLGSLSTYHPDLAGIRQD